MRYTHLSLEERHYIEIERKSGASANTIAKALNRSQTTISREIARNTGLRGYRHHQANRLAASRHAEKAKAIKMTDEIKATINGYIKEEWSPEQIAGWLKKAGIVDLHHETIYQHILSDKKSGGVLHKHLNNVKS